MDAEQAADLAGPRDPESFGVLPENEAATTIFLQCSTQWWHTEAGPTGLRYESVLAVMALYEVKDKRALLDDVRVMERAALMLQRARK